MSKKAVTMCFCVVGMALGASETVWAKSVGTAFTYQGRLTDGGSPATARYDFQFRLYDALSGGNQVGSTLTKTSVGIQDGYFTVELDFGNTYPGEARWLEIDVAPQGSHTFTTLAPRQELTPSPYAIYADKSDWDHLANLPADFADGVDDNTTYSVGAMLTLVGDTISHADTSTQGSMDNSFGAVVQDVFLDTAGHVTSLGSCNLDNRYFTEIEQKTSGGSQLHWDNLISVPAGFADGVDDVGSGDTDWIIAGSNMYAGVTGYVGVGTSTLGSKFAVEWNKTNNVNPIAVFRTTGSNSVSAIRFQNPNDNHYNLGIAQNDDFALGYNNNISLASDLLRITPDGYLGLGTINPTNHLDINSDDYNLGISLDGRKALGGYSGNSYLRLNPDGDFEKVYVHSVLETSDFIAADGGLNVGGNTDPGTNNLLVNGQASIGTTVQQHRLELGSTGDTYNYARIAASSYAGIMFFDGEGSHSGLIRYDHNDDFMEFETRSGVSTSERMRITSDGNIGIGTEAPTARTHIVNPGSNDVFRVDDETDDTSPFVISSVGGVGIGVSNPNAKLELQYSIMNVKMGHVDMTPSTYNYYNSVLGKIGDDVESSLARRFHHETSDFYRYYGVYAAALETDSETNYGIYSRASGAENNYAGYFFGDVEVSGDLKVMGTLTKGGGSFKIDHPLDPENKYLQHSFVESPDMMNVYNGNVTTDDKGFATVKMPDYFEALNGDFRYQLTVIGQFAQAIVAEKITKNQFKIQTDKPSVEVSWQVTGVRKDPYAMAHRIEVETEKAQADKGKYLYPEAYGLQAEQGINFVHEDPLHKSKHRESEIEVGQNSLKSTAPSS